MEPWRVSCVRDTCSGERYVTCARRTHGGLKISLTDGADVWSADIAHDALDTFTQKLSLKSPEDLCQTLSSGAVCLELKGEDFLFRSVSGSNLLDLTKMAAADAKQEVKQLLFKMADSLSLSAELSVSTTSPAKNHQRRAPVSSDFEPRQQNGASLVTAKKRVPGSSLINPGTKKKREATGVAFDDPDDDDDDDF